MSLRKFLYYSKSDRGSIVILSIIAILIVVIVFVAESGKDNRMVSNIANPADSAAILKSKAETTEEDTLPTITMHEFDPNTVDSATLVGFGLHPRQARTFIRYRNAGAVFRTPESLERVYGLTHDDLDRLMPYVRIGEKYAPPKRNTTTNKHYDKGNTDTLRNKEYKKDYPEKFNKQTKVDPNTADTTLLQRIPGIGKWIARNIITQRERLGGFHSVDQLLEVKHFSPELLQWFEIDSATVKLRKININTASFQLLNSHPYISYEQARDLLHYIRLYGKIADINSLKRTGIFSDDELLLLSPYTEF